MMDVIRFFSSAQAIDLILLGMLAEALCVRRWVRVEGHAVPWPDVIGVLLPGACLLLAVRGALTESPSLVVVALTAALITHLWDLRRRFRRSRDHRNGLASDSALRH
jgi:hypothetical protein